MSVFYTAVQETTLKFTISYVNFILKKYSLCKNHNYRILHINKVKIIFQKQWYLKISTSMHSVSYYLFLFLPRVVPRDVFDTSYRNFLIIINYVYVFLIFFIKPPQQCCTHEKFTPFEYASFVLHKS